MTGAKNRPAVFGELGMDRSAIALTAARGKDGAEEYFACALRLEDSRRVHALSESGAGREGAA